VSKTQNAEVSAASEVIQAGREVIRPIVLEHFHEDSCIATARITIDVLSYFGIHSRPAAVETIIFNGEAASLMRAGATPEQLRDAVYSRTPEQPDGPWSVGLGFRRSSEEAGGHVVVWVPSERVCLDFSLDQASRPHKGAILGPAVFKIAGAVSLDESGALPLDFVFSGEVAQPPPNGPAYVEYRVVPDWFRGSPNWRRTSVGVAGAQATFRDITGRAIKQIRSQIAR